MPETGIEPVRYCYRRILSPVRLPVPPLGLSVLKLCFYSNENYYTTGIFYCQDILKVLIILTFLNTIEFLSSKEYNSVLYSMQSCILHLFSLDFEYLYAFGCMLSIWKIIFSQFQFFRDFKPP